MRLHPLSRSYGWPTTRRLPRSMQEAFGPYTDRQLLPMPSRETRSERVAGAMLAVAIGVGLAAYLVAWWSA